MTKPVLGIDIAKLKFNVCLINDRCESVVGIRHGNSTTYGRHFRCGIKTDSVIPLFSTLVIFNY